MKKLGLADMLETERCILKIPEESEAREIWDLISEDTTKYMIWNKGDTVDQTLERIQENRKKAVSGETWECSVFLKETEKYIGICGINDIDSDIPSFTLGYWIGEESYGKGIIPECVKRILKYAFEESDFEKGIISCDSRNINSEKVALKCGFMFEGKFRNHKRIKGELRDTSFFGITREQYFSQK